MYWSCEGGPRLSRGLNKKLKEDQKKRPVKKEKSMDLGWKRVPAKREVPFYKKKKKF